MTMRVAEDTVQIHRGCGYSTECPVERYFKDAKVCGMYEGTNQVQSLMIAREVLEDQKDQSIPRDWSV